MAALRRREAHVVETWFLKYADAVHVFARYRVGPELAADVVQETFLKALERIGNYDPQRGAMLTWLIQTARNAVRSTRAREHRFVPLPEDQASGGLEWFASLAGIAEAPLPEAVVERAETGVLVQMALAGMRQDYRGALTRHYGEEWPLKDLARSCGISESAAKSLLHRARAAFRDSLRACEEALSAPDRNRG